ncbi:MAG: nucleoside triphosphate pyrophosphohydrolase [Armatimonadetes bacterium]|nr:nucleoside triphosphate pyrophosphohydrolase [Armatimonadota bacterium]
MEKLRAPDGCPWDREQTHQTLKKYLLEETYEVLEAIDAGNLAELKTELGDLMLQIIFHAQIAAEEGVFNIKDVLEAISEKLIRRHPHVFGDVKVACAEEVLHRWEEIKACEPGYEKRKSILDGVPRTLPALARAMEISKRAAGAGFEWPDMHAVLEKVREEISELENEIQVGNKERIADEIGDLLFTVVNVARWAKVDPEDALRRMTDRFIERFKQIEEVAQSSGRQLSQMSIEEMDAIWDRAKNAT